MRKHNVPAYIATRKRRALKVTLQVATPGAESAFDDCLVVESVKRRWVGRLARCVVGGVHVCAREAGVGVAVTARVNW